MQLDKMDDQEVYTIGEMSRVLAIKEHTIRFWESKFPSLKPRKSQSGRREYTHDNLLMLQKIKNLLYEEGYTLKGALKEIQEDNSNSLESRVEKISIQKERQNTTSEHKEILLKKQQDVSENNQKAVDLSVLEEPIYIEKNLSDTVKKSLYHKINALIQFWENIDLDS